MYFLYDIPYSIVLLYNYNQIQIKFNQKHKFFKLLLTLKSYKRTE